MGRSSDLCPRMYLKRLPGLLSIVLAAPLFLAALAGPAFGQGADGGLPRALELYRTGDYRAAEVIFQALLQTEPKNLTVRKMLADCLTREGRSAEARQQYQQILQISPGDVDATQALRPAPPPPAAPKPAPAPRANREAVERVQAGGEIERAEREIQAGRLDEAQTILEALHNRQPDAVVPQQRLAEIYTRTKQYSRAAELYEQLGMTSGTGSAAFLLRAAQNYSYAENYPEAVRLYHQYLSASPGDLPASLELANVLLWSNQLDEAVTAYRRYLDRRPDDFDARQNLGNALLWSKQYQAAIDEYNRLISRRPRDPELNLSLAQAYDQMGKADQALSLYQLVLDIRPGDPSASAARDRLVADQPRVNALAKMEQQDYKGAAQYFLSYLDKHPDSTETMLEIARAYAWGKQFTDSSKYYDLYLQRTPNDKPVVRELAKVELSIPSFSRARQDYEFLTNDPRSTVEDYEGLVHSFVWDDKLAAAQPAAKKLLELDPMNEVALETIKTYDTQQKAASLDRARSLTGEGRNTEAIAAYKSYIGSYGSNREIDLALSRLYGSNKQYAEAIAQYQNYLTRYPDDVQARLELADDEKYDKDYVRAEADYRAVLRTDSQRTDPSLAAQALVGIAQIKDYRGDDAFDVVSAYRQVVQTDVANPTANQRLEELSPQVSPSIGYRDNTFSDSDGFGRSTNGLEASFPLAAGLRLTPFVNYDYFSQERQIGGSDCGAASAISDPRLLALSNQICSSNGITHGAGGGVRIGLSAGSHFLMTLEGGEMAFSQTRDDVQARAEVQVRGSGGKLLTLSYVRRNGAYDLNVIAPLFAGVTGQNGFLSYQQPINSRWDFWIGGGMGRYSAGLDGTSPVNTQKIFSARMEYKVLPDFTAGYYVRATTFTAPSMLYFSPNYYGTYGFLYDLHKSIAPNVSLNASGELGYGKIDRYGVPGLNTLEFVVYPAVVWRVRPSLELHLGYRFGRGSTSAFNTAAYTSGVFEVTLQNYFVPPAGQGDANRLDIH